MNFYKYQLKYLIINQKCNKDINKKDSNNHIIVINNQDINQDIKISHINKIEDINKDNMNQNNIILINIQKKTVFMLQICHSLLQENN